MPAHGKGEAGSLAHLTDAAQRLLYPLPIFLAPHVDTNGPQRRLPAGGQALDGRHETRHKVDTPVAAEQAPPGRPHDQATATPEAHEEAALLNPGDEVGDGDRLGVAHVPHLDAAVARELHDSGLAAGRQHDLCTLTPGHHPTAGDVKHMFEHRLAAAGIEGLEDVNVHPPDAVELPRQVADADVGDAGAGPKAGEDDTAGATGRLVALGQHRLGGAPVIADACIISACLNGRACQLRLEAVERPQC